MPNSASKNPVRAKIHTVGNVAGDAAEAGFKRGHPVQIIPIPARKAIGAPRRATKSHCNGLVLAAENVENKPL